MIYRLFVLLMALKAISGTDPESAITCEPMKSDMCRTRDNVLLYNMTGMPNFAGHKNQADAIFQMATYFPLISTGCAAELQLFLCSIYVPMCETHSPQRLIGPCRPLCQKVRRQCEPVLVKTFEHVWPDILNCQRFPETNDHGHMCIDIPENRISLGLPTKSLNSLTSNQLFMDKVKEKMSNSGQDLPDSLKPFKDFTDLLEHNLEPAKGINMECKDLKKSFKYTYIKRKGCIPKCNVDITFTKDAKHNTQIWVISLAAICFFTSLLTVVTYILNSCQGESHSAVAFANRAPAFLAFVYVGYSLGYLISQIGLKHNPEWLCIDYNEDTLLTAQEGQRSQPCIIIFFLVYFFGSATSTWWTVVAFSWALAQYSSPKKSAMDTISMFCHLYGWGIPAILTLVAILQHNIEADELTSVCLPGALRDDNNFLAFIVIPEGIQLAFGTVMYVAGLFWAFFCGDATTNEAIRGKTEATALSSFKLKFTFFGLTHCLVKIAVFATLVYEYLSRHSWLHVNTKDLPNVNIFWIRLVLLFLVGMIMPMWIINKQTKLNCFSLWNVNKAPNITPSTFPTVAYKPQQTIEMMSLTKKDSISINRIQRRDYL